MHRLSVSARLALCLACLTISVLLFARTLGLLPDDRAATLRGRAKLCESMAIHLSMMASQGQTTSMQTALEAVAERNPEVLSLAVRQIDNGTILAEVGDHARHWEPPAEGQSTETHLYIPILHGDSEWGGLEVSFTPIGPYGWWSSRVGRFLLLIGFVLICCGVMYYLYLRKVLKQLNPQKVIPGRVKMALDTMAEGLVILDDQGVIMLANSAFAETVDRETDVLLGQSLEEFPWEQHKNGEETFPLPWTTTLESGSPVLGGIVHLPAEEDKRLTFLINVSPILDPTGQNRGALVSFDDITQLEKNKRELHETLENLRKSSDEIRRQNRELEQLATRDPLTSCYNRRSFFERFNALWKSAMRHDHPLSCVMVDVDHFKSINDNHGHSVGDQVLQRVGQVLNQTARETDIVCRYGGEEFAVLLPYTSIADAAQTAERFRLGLENAKFSNLSITASLGVSDMSLGSMDPQGLLDQADKCLYVAKRNGRNQVVRYDDVPEDLEVDESQISRTKPAETSNPSAIPLQAVTALVSALAYRDVATAEHSRRVADLCVA
ncbi:MAG: diguanylate cyclase, partial [Planctomycetaceae bacterium]|nr:diguanylate cyclase [Planctomycetaceae bacterium]